MKTKAFVMLVLVVLAFSQLLMAQENEKTDVSFSFGIPLIYVEEATEGNVISSQMGLNLNFMFFKNSNFGYYVNIYGLYYMVSIPHNVVIDDNYADISLNVDIGIIPGIGYKKSINNYLSFFAGIGPEIRFSFLDLVDTPVTQIGIGIGGTLEARLQLYRNFSFAGGVLISSNFFSRMDRNISAHPYVGLSWN